MARTEKIVSVEHEMSGGNWTINVEFMPRAWNYDAQSRRSVTLPILGMHPELIMATANMAGGMVEAFIVSTFIEAGDNVQKQFDEQNNAEPVENEA